MTSVERDWGTARERDATFDLAVATERARQTSHLGQTLQSYVYPTVVIVAFLLIWQVVTVVFSVPRYLLPSPLQVGEEIFDKASLLTVHGFVTLSEILLGFIVSVIVAVPLAVVMTYSRTIERAL